MTLEFISRFFTRNSVYSLHDILEYNNTRWAIIDFNWYKERNTEQENFLETTSLGKLCTYFPPKCPPAGSFPNGCPNCYEDLSNPNNEMGTKEGLFFYIRNLKAWNPPAIIRQNWYEGGRIVRIKEDGFEHSGIVTRIAFDPKYEKVFGNRLRPETISIQ